MISNQNYVALLISVLIGAGMPALVGLVTHEKIPSWVKAVLLLASTTITGLLSQWLNAITTNVHFAWQAAVFTAIATYVTAIASHFGFLIPTGVTAFVASKGITASPDPVQPEVRPLTNALAGMIIESPAFTAQEAAKMAMAGMSTKDARAAAREVFQPVIDTIDKALTDGFSDVIKKSTPSNAAPAEGSTPDWEHPMSASPVVVEDVRSHIESDISDKVRASVVNAEPLESLPGHPSTPRHARVRTDPADRPKRAPRKAAAADPAPVEHDPRIARD